MERSIVGDVFKVKKHFNFCGASYGVGERFKAVSIHLDKELHAFGATFQSMYDGRSFTISLLRFQEYMRDGYFARVKIGEEQVDKMDEFKLEVGDIIETKEDTLTIVKDCRGGFYAVSHDDYSMLEVEGMFVKYETEDSEIRKVHRHSVCGGDNFDYDDYTLVTKTQVYPKPKVKLTLSEIKSKFKIENEEIEIDFEN